MLTFNVIHKYEEGDQCQDESKDQILITLQNMLELDDYMRLAPNVFNDGVSVYIFWIRGHEIRLRQ